MTRTVAGLNGVARGRLVASQPVKASRRELSARRRVALGVGGVGTFVLALSVSHCTEALVMTTGSGWFMAGLMAIGIDVGMVMCKVSATIAGRKARRMAEAYVVLTVVLSMVLNALASAAAAQPGYAVMAYGVGAMVPVLVLLLFAVASRLWTEG